MECTAEGYLQGSCSMDEACPSRSVWGRVQQAILGVLDSTSLEDIRRADLAHRYAPQFVPIESLGAQQSSPENLVPA